MPAIGLAVMRPVLVSKCSFVAVPIACRRLPGFLAACFLPLRLTRCIHPHVGLVQAELVQTINLDLLNTVISPYGFVRKLVTYSRPEGGMLAWAQFIDASTANSVGCRSPAAVLAMA